MHLHDTIHSNENSEQQKEELKWNAISQYQENDLCNAEKGNDDMIVMNLHDTMGNDCNDKWVCSQCTLINDSTSTKCDACTESRAIINDTYSLDIQHEESLRDKVLQIVFNFDEMKRKQHKQWITDIDDEKEGIKTHYKMLSRTSFIMRGEMKFKHNNVMDYYSYLESGIDKPTVIGLSDQDALETKIIDADHQFIYHKPNIGFLRYIFAGRDVCFIRRRFQLPNYMHNNICYDTCGTLNYSINKTHPLHVKQTNDYIRGKILYRSFTLVHSKHTNKTVLYYVSCCDLGGDLPQWLVQYNLGNHVLSVNKVTSDMNLKTFRDSWNDKMKCLHQKRMLGKHTELKKWLTDVVGLQQYFNVFVDNGFEDVSYFKYGMEESVLEAIGIGKKGHRLRLIYEISKL